MQIRFHVFLISLCELPFLSLEFLLLFFQAIWHYKRLYPIDLSHP